MINTFLTLWRKIPKEEREAKVHEYSAMGAEFLKQLSFTTPTWLDGLLLKINPTAYGIKAVATLVQHFMIGYLERMASLDPVILVKNLERFLTNFTRVDYLTGLIEGTIEGVFGWFKDLWQMAVDIAKIAGEIADIDLNELGKFGKDVAEFLIKAANAVKDSNTDLISFLQDFNPLDLLAVVEDALKAGGRKIGELLADTIISITGKSPADLGHGIGVLIGYAIPEVLLAVFSASISAAIKTGVQAFKTAFNTVIKPLLTAFSEFKKMLGPIREALKLLRVVIEDVKKFVAMLAKSGKEKLGKVIQDLLEGLERLLKGKLDEVAEEATTKVDDVSHLDDANIIKNVGFPTNKVNKAIEKGFMNSSDELMGVEKASDELIAAVSKKRRVIIAKEGSEELRMLEYFEAEASVGGEDMASVLLRENPSKAAILEEFLHGTQHKLGIIDDLGRNGAEAHVKDFMIRHQKILGLGDDDIKILKRLMELGY